MGHKLIVIPKDQQDERIVDTEESILVRDDVSGVLNVVSKNLTEIDQSVGNLVNLTLLLCNNNQLTALPDTIDNLVNLTKLSCRSNQLTALPDTIGNLVNLTELYCSENQLTTLPDTIGNLVNLTELYCSNNLLTTLPDNIDKLVNLTVLTCSNNKLTALPDTIGNLVNLTKLYCRNNQLTVLPDTTGNLVNLTELDCSNNQLTVLPDTTGNLVNLTELDCSNNPFTVLPDTIGNLVNLTKLWCNSNQLTTLPDTIGNLVKLTELYCSNNLLTTLPDNIDKLVNLTVLTCDNNKLTALPDTIGNLVNLTKLYCRNNQLTVLPDTTGNLVNLTELDCSNNRLTALPDTFGNLVNLTQLGCNNNQLTALPDTIGNLGNLTKLRCNNNQLNALPDTIGNLGNLTELYCNNNHLTALPDIIGYLVNLTKLDGSNNRLTVLPETIGDLVNLMHLQSSHSILEAVSTFQTNQVWEINKFGEVTKKTSTDTAICPPHGKLLVSIEFSGTLDFSNARLSQIPESVFQLKYVSKLVLSDSTFMEIPEDIELCQNLQELDVSNNDVLKSFPDNLWKCGELRVVRTKGCQYAIQLLKSLTKSVETSKESRKMVLDDLEFINVEKLDYERGDAVIQDNWVFFQRTGKPPPFSSLPKEKLMKWNSKPDVQFKLLIKFMICSVLLALSVYSMFVMSNDVCESPTPLSCQLVCGAEALANQPQISAVQCLSACTTQNYLRQVEMCGLPGAPSQPERDDIHGIKVVSIVLSMILLLPHIVDVGNVMDQVLQIPFREKLYTILERHDRLSERVDGAGIIKYNVYGFLSSITNVLCCFQFGCFRPSKLKVKRTRARAEQNWKRMLSKLMENKQARKEQYRNRIEPILKQNDQEREEFVAKRKGRTELLNKQRESQVNDPEMNVDEPANEAGEENVIREAKNETGIVSNQTKLTEKALQEKRMPRELKEQSNTVIDRAESSCEEVADEFTEEEVEGDEILVELEESFRTVSEPVETQVEEVIQELVEKVLHEVEKNASGGTTDDQVATQDNPDREEVEEDENLAESKDLIKTMSDLVEAQVEEIIHELVEKVLHEVEKNASGATTDDQVVKQELPDLHEVEAELRPANPKKETETEKKRIEILIEEPITKGYLQEEKPIDPIHTLEGVWLYDLESGKKLREMPSNVWGKLCGWAVTLKGCVQERIPNWLDNSISCLPSRNLDCVKPLWTNRIVQACKHQLQRACSAIHQKASSAVQRVSIRVKNIDRHWWMIVVVEWVDTVQTWSLFPLSYFVIMGSGSIGDVIVNVVAVSVYARLDDEAVEMFTRPQKSLLERWQLYTGSVEDLQNSGELGLVPREDTK